MFNFPLMFLSLSCTIGFFLFHLLKLFQSPPTSFEPNMSVLFRLMYLSLTLSLSLFYSLFSTRRQTKSNLSFSSWKAKEGKSDNSIKTKDPSFAEISVRRITCCDCWTKLDIVQPSGLTKLCVDQNLCTYLTQTHGCDHTFDQHTLVISVDGLLKRWPKYIWYL